MPLPQAADAHRPALPGTPLTPAFFDRDAQVVACDLIGKVLCHAVDGHVLWARIVEAEAYYRAEKASHASLGYTEKRRALFMPPGTIYMYYARGGDSFNVSCAGPGNAVLFKAGAVPADDARWAAMIAEMQRRTPLPSGRVRASERLCSGQTLLCKALGLRVPEWDGVPLGTPPLWLLDDGARPRALVRTTRLGIPPGRDGHLPYRFIDREAVRQATHNPLGRSRREGRDYTLVHRPPPAAGTSSAPGSESGTERGAEPDWAAALEAPRAG